MSPAKREAFFARLAAAMPDPKSELEYATPYELLVAVAPQRFDELAAVAGRLNLTLTAIGELRRGTGVTWALEGLSFAAPARGYDHFR